MTLWILWSIATSTLLAAGTAALDRAASLVGVPRRLVWAGAILSILVAPLLVAFRSTSVASRSAVVTGNQTTATVFAPSRALSPVVAHSAPAAADARREIQNVSRGRSSVVRAEWRDTFAAWSIVAGRADRFVIPAWIIASSILLVLFAAAVLRLGIERSRWRMAADADLGDVLVAPDVGPAVVGFLRPRIVLPSWALSADAGMRELLLRHEIEHLRAGDTRALLAAELTVVAFPWNAALWWMVRRLRLAIEMDCDARVIRAVGGVYEYASMLLAVGERYSVGLPLAASLVEPRSNLEARIEAMIADRKRRPAAACVAMLAVGAVMTVTAAWTPRPDPLHRTRVLAVPVVRRVGDSVRMIRPPVARRGDAVVPSPATSEMMGRGIVRHADLELPEPQRVPLVALEDSTLSAVGYLQRKQLGRGFFIDGQMLDRRASSFSQMLRTVPGLRISPTGDGRTNVIEDAANPTGGCVNTFVDGRLWESVTPGDIDEYVRPTEVLAIEAYHGSETPAQFTRSDRSGCATVVVWTKAWMRSRTSRSGDLRFIDDDSLLARINVLTGATDSLLRELRSAQTAAAASLLQTSQSLARPLQTRRSNGVKISGTARTASSGPTVPCAVPDSVAIRGLSRLRDADVRSTLGVVPGTRISGPILAQALERLYATNNVEPTAWVSCEIIDGEVLVVFNITERSR